MNNYPDDCPNGPPDPVTRFCDNCKDSIDYDDETAEMIGTLIYCKECHEALFVRV